MIVTILKYILIDRLNDKSDQSNHTIDVLILFILKCTIVFLLIPFLLGGSGLSSLLEWLNCS